MVTYLEDYGWSPLFAGLAAPCEPQAVAILAPLLFAIPAEASPKGMAASEPQTGALAPMVALVVEARAEGLLAPCEPQAEKAAVAVPHRKTEALEDTFWVLHEVRPGGIVLRDGVEGHWYEETLWHPGGSLGRSYAIVHQGQEYEFHSQLTLRNSKRKLYPDPEAEPPAEAA